jgi:hypothetical protein
VVGTGLLTAACSELPCSTSFYRLCHTAIDTTDSCKCCVPAAAATGGGGADCCDGVGAHPR